MLFMAAKACFGLSLKDIFFAPDASSSLFMNLNSKSDDTHLHIVEKSYTLDSNLNIILLSIIYFSTKIWRKLSIDKISEKRNCKLLFWNPLNKLKMDSSS